MASVTSLDTTPDARREQVAILKRRTPQERVRMAVSMSMDAREMTRAGIRFRHPDWDEARVRRELLVRLYGAELVERALGPSADE